MRPALMQPFFAMALFALATLAASVARAETITVSTNNTPQDRKALDVLAHEAFRRIGHEFKLASLPSERSLRAADAGEVDGEGLRVAGLADKYPNLIQVPEHFIGISFVAFASDPTIRLDAGWDSLKPYRVAFITGWKMFEANAANAQVVNKVEQPEQLFRMLESGRIDLALYTLADGVALARGMGLATIQPVRPTLKDVDMYLYLNRKHADLVAPLAAALRAMKADGSYDRLLAGVEVR
jgi:polar amino acid transport system substrate-binding protein